MKKSLFKLLMLGTFIAAIHTSCDNAGSNEKIITTGKDSTGVSGGSNASGENNKDSHANTPREAPGTSYPGSNDSASKK